MYYFFYSSSRYLCILKEDCNVILTDWNPANYFPYTQATANAQVVGAEIALLVNTMIKTHGADPVDFHIIAHSLGAAVAGYAGYRIDGLGRITGTFFSCLFIYFFLNFFELLQVLIQLVPSLPMSIQSCVLIQLMLNLLTSFIQMEHPIFFLVLVSIRSSSNIPYKFMISSAGTLEQLGHVDFYPNGGINQPSCPTASGKLIDSILTLGPMDIIGPMDIQGKV